MLDHNKYAHSFGKLWNIYAIICLTAILYLLLWIISNGTHDDGDSITHYLISKHAVQKPILFYDHWGKPVFTFLSSPFSQFGYCGIKIFNLLCILVSQFLLYQISIKLELKNALLVPVIFGLMPYTFLMSQSGLTEPIFAVILCMSILLYIKEWDVLATICISFLPFARSEGLVILCIAFLYIILNRKYYALLYLMVGHLVYGYLGMKYYDNDFLWTLHNIPYDSGAHSYGLGNWFYYIQKTPQLVGIVFFIVFIFGSFYWIVDIIKQIRLYNLKSNLVILILIFGSISGIYFFHTYAWAMGKYNSAGLIRVIYIVLPLMSIINVFGFNRLSSLFHKITFPRLVLYSCLLNTLLVSYNLLSKDKCILSENQNKIKTLVNYLKDSCVIDEHSYFIVDNSYAKSLLGIGPISDNTTNIGTLLEKNRKYPTHSYIIWDYYSSFNFSLTLDSIINQGKFDLLKLIRSEQNPESEPIALLKIKPAYTINFKDSLTNVKYIETKNSISHDKNYMTHVKRQAFLKNITIDSCLGINAKYIMCL